MTAALSTPSSDAAPAPSRAARIWRRTVVGVSLALAVTLILWSSYLPQGAMIAGLVALILSAGGAAEAGRMGLLGRFPAAFAVIAACLAVLATQYGIFSPDATLRVPDWNGPGRYFGSLLLTTLAGAVVLLVGTLPTLLGPSPSKGTPRHVRPAQVLLWGLWIAVPLTGMVPIRLYAGASGLVALVLLSKVGDIVGYYVGSWMGKTHPFPKISPGKTTAGCVGSFVAGTLFGYLCLAMGLLPEPRFGVLSGLLAGATINLASQAGDLLESVAKRRCGVKDSSSVFGPSGGFLDVVDSLLLSLPVALITWPVLFELPYLAEGLRALGGQ